MYHAPVERPNTGALTLVEKRRLCLSQIVEKYKRPQFKTSRVCIMSSSDYITMKKYKNMRNIFTTKESGNNIQKLKINTILNGYKVDEYNDIIPNKWFNVNLSCPPNDPCIHIKEVEEIKKCCCGEIGDEYLCCSHSIIFDVTNTYPIMFKPSKI